MSEQHTPELCPVCGEGHLSRPFSIKECDSCGSDVSTPDLVEMNHRLQQAEKQRDELLAALERIEKYGHGIGHGSGYTCANIAEEAIAKASGKQ